MLSQTTPPRRPASTSPSHTWRQTARDLLDDYAAVEDMAVRYARDAEVYRAIALAALTLLEAEQAAAGKARLDVHVERQQQGQDGPR